MIRQSRSRLDRRALKSAVRMAAVCCGLSLVSGFCADTSSGSSEYLITTWGREEGLPQSSVTSIVQTRDGYLWLGTFNGLARFDGARFTVFNMANAPQLPGNRIHRLFEDRHKTLWISCEGGGLASLSGGRFKRWFADGQLPAQIDSVLSGEDGLVLGRTKDGAVIVLVEGEKGRVLEGLKGVKGEPLAEDGGGFWVLTVTNHLLRFEDGNLVTRADNWGLTSVFCQEWSLDEAQRLWVATEQEIAFYQNGRFVPVLRAAANGPFRVENLAANRDGSFWAALNGRLLRFKNGERVADAGDWPLTPLSSARGMPRQEDREGNQWWGFFGAGLFRIGPDGSRLHVGREDGLPSDRIRALCEDREGSMWVGLDGGGLARLRRSRLRVFGERDGLSKNSMLSVCEDSAGDVWMGSNGGGLNRLRSGVATHFDLGRDGTKGFVWSVFPDRHGNLWAGTYEDGLWRWAQDRFVPAFDGARIQNQVLSIYEDREGRLWLGNSRGVTCWHEGRFTTYTSKDGLSHDDIRAIAEDAEGNLWFGSNGGGLTRWQNGRFTQFRAKDGLAHDTVWALHPDVDGSLWIGTFGGGLSHFKNGRFTNFGKKHGLPDEIICHITEDAQGDLWMSSYAGLWRVTKAALESVAEGWTDRLSCLTFTRTDGLPTLEFSGGFQPSGWKGRNGHLWFPTEKGVVMVTPARLRLNPLPPPVILQAMLVDGKPVMTTEANLENPGSNRASEAVASVGGRIASASPVQIGPGARNFGFAFVGLSLVDANKVLYKYRLEGMQSDWMEAGTRCTAQYNYIPPGSYTFRVTACNNDGVWNEHGAALAFTVLPPFYTRWWFLATSAVSAAGLIAGTVRVLSVRGYKRKLDRLLHRHALERERARIAQDIHDDIGTSLTHIKLLGEMAEVEGTLPGVLTHTRKMAGTAREMVEALDEIVWAVNPRNDTLEDLASYLFNFAEEFFRKTPVRCRFQVPSGLPDWPLSSEVRHNLFLVVKEALHNLIKHANAGTASLSLSLRESTLTIIIRDDGGGFSPDSVKPGDGLLNMRQRLETIGGEMVLRSTPGQGTTLEFKARLKPPTSNAYAKR